MKPVDYRNATWDELQGRLDALRAQVWHGMEVEGVAHTTREWAEILGVDLLTVRPRITELCEMGFAELVQRAGCPRSREGLYRSLSPFEARRRFEERCREAREPQLELKLS
jgi:hypothetical protein